MTYGDSDIIICRCQELTKADIRAAIRDGAETVNGVKKRTKACMGFCQGKTCEKLIERIVAEATGKDPAVLVPPTSRAPVRPVDIRVFLDTEDEQT